MAGSPRAAVQAGLSEDKSKRSPREGAQLGCRQTRRPSTTSLPSYSKPKQVSDDTFAAVKKSVGERGVVDLLATSGFYQIVFDVHERRPAADGK